MRQPIIDLQPIWDAAGIEPDPNGSPRDHAVTLFRTLDPQLRELTLDGDEQVGDTQRQVKLVHCLGGSAYTTTWLLNDPANIKFTDDPKLGDRLEETLCVAGQLGSASLSVIRNSIPVTPRKKSSPKEVGISEMRSLEVKLQAPSSNTSSDLLKASLSFTPYSAKEGRQSFYRVASKPLSDTMKAPGVEHKYDGTGDVEDFEIAEIKMTLQMLADAIRRIRES